MISAIAWAEDRDLVEAVDAVGDDDVLHVELPHRLADEVDEVRLVDAHQVAAPRGLISGPMMVKKIVLIPSASSGKKTFSIKGWKFGA